MQNPQQNQNKFEILRMPPENTNSVLVACGADAAIFDPWGRADDWSRVLSARGLTLREIYATHGHPDHISAAADLSRKYNAPWYMSPADNSLIGWGNELLYFPNEKILLTGDTVFHDGFGRYDFPGGNQQELFQSISNLYNMNLPADTYVVHGHGTDSTIAGLKESNPYFRAI